MKIQIENIPDRWDDLNEVLEFAVKCSIVAEMRLIQDVKPINRSLKIGFGSSHCWVSRKSDNERILLITDK